MWRNLEPWFRWMAAGCLVPVMAGGAMGMSSDERAIRALDEAWSEALQNRRLEEVMTNYAEDAVFLPPHVPIVEGKQKIREWFAARISAPGYSASFVPTRIVVSRAGDLAYEIGTFRATVQDGQGRPTVGTGKHLVTWQKRDGHWKVVAECINRNE